MKCIAQNDAIDSDTPPLDDERDTLPPDDTDNNDSNQDNTLHDTIEAVVKHRVSPRSQRPW